MAKAGPGNPQDSAAVRHARGGTVSCCRPPSCWCWAHGEGSHPACSLGLSLQPDQIIFAFCRHRGNPLSVDLVSLGQAQGRRFLKAEQAQRPQRVKSYPPFREHPHLQSYTCWQTSFPADILWLVFSYIGCCPLLRISVICGFQQDALSEAEARCL